MPVYNGIEYIDQSIKSVKYQTIPDWELIIAINGHPEDSETYKIAKGYENDKIKVYQFLDIKGKSRSLNRMVDLCTYKWVAILDVDDVWLPKKLESQFPFMDTYDVIGTHCKYFGDLNHSPNIPIGDITSFDFLRFNPIINSSSLIKKELAFWNCDYDTGAQDYEMWIRLWKDHKKFYNVNTIQILHRIHDDSHFNAKGNSLKAKELVNLYK